MTKKFLAEEKTKTIIAMLELGWSTGRIMRESSTSRNAINAIRDRLVCSEELQPVLWNRPCLTCGRSFEGEYRKDYLCETHRRYDLSPYAI